MNSTTVFIFIFLAETVSDIPLMQNYIEEDSRYQKRWVSFLIFLAPLMAAMITHPSFATGTSLT